MLKETNPKKTILAVSKLKHRGILIIETVGLFIIFLGGQKRGFEKLIDVRKYIDQYYDALRN